MPNTLAHLGVQGLFTRTVIKEIDLKLVYIGCILPDLPWIFQRLIKVAHPGVDLFDLRLYAIVQASLFFCLVLSAILAMFFCDFWKTFIVIGINSFLHLLIDALQTKWANGVHFFAPFNWQLTNFGFFWPESLPTYTLTVVGLIVIIINWQRTVTIPFRLSKPSRRRLTILALLVIGYFLIPIYLIPFSEAANNHFVKTLRSVENRPGSYVEFDRGYCFQRPSVQILQAITDEEFEAENIELAGPATVSIRGTFVTKDRVQVLSYHIHANGFRDGASYIGLLLVLVLCIHTFAKQLRGAS